MSLMSFELKTENIDLKKKVSTLTDDILSLNAEIRHLTKELLHGHGTENNNLAMLFQTILLRPSPV